MQQTVNIENTNFLRRQNWIKKNVLEKKRKILYNMTSFGYVLQKKSIARVTEKARLWIKVRFKFITGYLVPPLVTKKEKIIVI
jgi:hypothetical protein